MFYIKIKSQRPNCNHYLLNCRYFEINESGIQSPMEEDQISVRVTCDLIYLLCF